MAKRKINLKFVYDAPVSLSFILISVLFFLIKTFTSSIEMQSFLVSPTSTGVMAFSFTNLKSLLSLFLYIFGSSDSVSFFTNLLFIVLIGPSMEERYGSFVIGIMVFVSGFFAGVLNACFCSNSMSGCSSVVFMFVLLDAMMKLSKNKLTGTSIAMVFIFITREILSKNPNGMIGVVIILAGGLCGSLFAFLASPKARIERKNNKNKVSFKEDKKAKKSYDDETTVVGTLKF